MTKIITVCAAAAALLAHTATAYNLVNEFNKANFFQEFEFFDKPDPTHGWVEYVNNVKANKDSYAGYVNDGVYLGLDYTTANPPKGRESTRVSSIKSWTKGLFITDIVHMPGAACGVWPAYWTVGTDWPNHGEIDIIEGVHTQGSNSITLHTGPDCKITADGGAGATLNSPNCNENQGYTGCGQSTSDKANYGDGFNSGGGGVYATEWTEQSISVWFFPRKSIPADIASRKPDPASWGKPVAKFNGGQGCNLDQHFKEHNIVFDTTFCGDWAGNVWEEHAECAAQAVTCQQFVSQNPAAFEQAYWLINYVQVYQK